MAKSPKKQKRTINSSKPLLASTKRKPVRMKTAPPPGVESVHIVDAFGNDRYMPAPTTVERYLKAVGGVFYWST